MTDDLSSSIETNASGPRRASGDSGSVEQHSLPDQIAADRYLRSNAAARKRGWPFRPQKMVPPGTV